METAVQYNNTRLFHFLVNNEFPIISETLCKRASSISALNIIRWLYNNRDSKRYVIEKIKWDPKYGFDNLGTICNEALVNNNFVVLDWLDSINYWFNEAISINAIYAQNEPVVNWLYNRKKLLLNPEIYIRAIYQGNIWFLMWSKQIGIVIDLPITVYNNPIEHNDFEMIKFINENLRKWNEYVCCHAASRGKLNLLKLLRLNGCPWDNTTCLQCISPPNHEMLKWAIDNGCPIDFKECYKMAKNTKWPVGVAHLLKGYLKD